MALNEFSIGSIAEQTKRIIYQSSPTSAAQSAEGAENVVVYAVPVFERTIGLAANSALAFASTLGDLSSLNGFLTDLLKQINAVNFPGQPNCKVLPKVIGDANEVSIDSDDSNAFEICFDKIDIVKSASGFKDDKNAAEFIANIFDLISQLTKPADPADCINPYFDQFFNLVPVQFILTKILKDLVKKALGNLSDQEVQEIVREVKPCGSELEKIYTNNLNIPEIPLPLFKLPPLPTIPNINLYTVLNKLIVETICYTICVIMTPTILILSKKLNEILQKFLTDEEMGAGSYSEFMNNSLAKIRLNEIIKDEILNQAIRQGLVGDYLVDLKEIIGIPKTSTTKLDRSGLWRKPSSEEEAKVIIETISLIRKYFDEIYNFISEPFDKKVYSPKDKKYVTKQSTRELGSKELIFLMMGEYNCFTIQDLIKIGSKPEFSKLKLSNEQRITTFFEFLNSDFDPMAVVADLKSKACPPDPCEKVEEEAVQEVQNKMAELCKILNTNKSGLPPIPINKILETLGLQDLFNEGVKEQFKQLKTENLLFLGFPSMTAYPTIESLSTFLPKENGLLNEYDLWNNNKDTFSQDLFKKYYLRGGPPLVWKYDKIDLNQNLKDSTLEDICDDDEPFIVTFTYIFNDIFGLKLNNFETSLQKKKEEYKKSFEAEVKNEYEIRK